MMESIESSSIEDKKDTILIQTDISSKKNRSKVTSKTQDINIRLQDNSRIFQIKERKMKVTKIINTANNTAEVEDKLEETEDPTIHSQILIKFSPVLPSPKVILICLPNFTKA